MNMLFTEKEARFSPFIKFESASAAAIPKLSVLRVEMERVQPGMSDFILRVASPKYEGAKKSGTVLSFRGTRAFTKYDTIQKLSKAICAEMKKRGDDTHDWDSADATHLSDLVYGVVKFFASNVRVETMHYTTEALA